MSNKPITRAAVLAYAAELRAAAEEMLNPESEHYRPFYKPYEISDDGAQTLVTRKQAELVDALGPNATEMEIVQARAKGPAHALREMKWVAKQRERSFQEDLVEERARRARHANRHARAANERERARRGLTPGQRIDMALAESIRLGNGGTTSFNPKVARGKNEDAVVPRLDDPAASVRRIATKAVKDVEDAVQAAKVGAANLQNVA